MTLARTLGPGKTSKFLVSGLKVDWSMLVHLKLVNFARKKRSRGMGAMVLHWQN